MGVLEMVKIDVTALRESLSDAVSRAAFGGERFLVERRGKPVCAIVPVADLNRIEGVRNELPRGKK